MLDTFNNEVRRVAMLIDYGQPTDHLDRMVVVAAKLYVTWAGEMPEPVIRTAPETASGEFIAR